MSEVRVRWAVRVDGLNVEHWSDQSGNIWTSRSQRALFDSRVEALRKAAEFGDSYRARLVKVTFKKKQRKSLGLIACNAQINSSFPAERWTGAVLGTRFIEDWERAAQAVQAELERRGWRRP